MEAILLDTLSTAKPSAPARRRKRRHGRAHEDELGRQVAALDSWDYWGEPQKATRIEREEKRGRKRKRHKNAEPFAKELAMLAHGATVDHVLASAFGVCPMGLQWQATVGQLVTHARVEDGFIAEERQRSPDSECARHMVHLVLRVLNGMRRHGGKISLKGPKAYWGRQHRVREIDPETVMYREEMKRAELEAAGLEASRVSVPHIEREYVRKDSQGGLAGRVGVCIRTLSRYAALLRLALLIGCRQPKRGAEDAVMPREGDWAYPEWSILRSLPESTLRRLREWWGEVKPFKRSRPQRTPEPAPAPSPSLPLATGPPPSAPAELGTANVDVEPPEGLAEEIIKHLQSLMGTREHEQRKR